MTPPELSLSMRPEQRMLLLPRMLQALDVLQLSQPGLDDLVATALAENEALALRREPREEAPGPAPRDRRRAPADAADRKDRFLQSCPDRAGTLADHLRSQLPAVDAPPRVLELLRALIESLDGAGYRTLDDAEWGGLLAPAASPEELAAAEAELARLDPPAAGARGPVDAILRQISRTDPDRPLVERLLREHLEDLARQRRGTVAESLGLDSDELALLLAKIGKLPMRPAAGFSGDEAARVRPDFAVRRTAEGIEVRPADGSVAELVLDSEVLAAARDRATPSELRAHLRERIESAKALLRCLGQRRATLERVVKALFVRQVPFLEHGPRHLRPLRMQQIAETLSIHPSTISRAVAGKYVETAWGIFRLRDFFEAGVATTAGPAGSRSSLRDAIRECFAAEDPRRPIGDDDVVEALRAKGYLLARRTVAKYRAELGIASSWHRHESARAAARA